MFSSALCRAPAAHPETTGRPEAHSKTTEGLARQQSAHRGRRVASAGDLGLSKSRSGYLGTTSLRRRHRNRRQARPRLLRGRICSRVLLIRDSAKGTWLSSHLSAPGARRRCYLSKKCGPRRRPACGEVRRPSLGWTERARPGSPCLGGEVPRARETRVAKSIQAVVIATRANK